MIRNKVYQAGEIDFGIGDIADREDPRKVLMCHPEYFEVLDVKNIHMKEQGGKVNKRLAIDQWEALKMQYHKLVTRRLLEEVLVIPGTPGCEDMVFAANQSFPWLSSEGEKVVVISNMYHESRKKEVQAFETFYQMQGYRILHLTGASFFEGMGDAIPHPSKRLLYGGYGHRSGKNAYEEICELLAVPVVSLELRDERFYHLDTCFVPMDQHTALICKEAFTEEGINAIGKLFNRVIDIPADEASNFFSLNAHVVANKKSPIKVAILQKGSVATASSLADFGFEVIETDTSEYMKSGGSVFCMKMMMY